MKIDVPETLKQGITAHQSGDLDAAASAYGEILVAIPGHADATHLMGLVNFQTGDNENAARMIRDAITLDPKVSLYQANLGRVLTAMGDDKGAVSAFREAVILEPETAVLHADLAGAMLRSGDADGARARAHLALELDAGLAEAHLNLGLALQELRGAQHADAIASLNRAMEINPGLAGAYLGLGVALHEQGSRPAAEQTYQKALALDPTFIEAHCNLGNLKRDACAFDEAAVHYRAALALDENQAIVWGNLGVALQESGDIEAALDAYDRAVQLSPESPEIRRNRGLALLSAGNFAEGWKDYEYRLQTPRFLKRSRDWQAPVWTGESLKRKHILVHAEQGLGDSIQFCRYIPLLAKAGAKVTLECAKSLRPLMRSVDGVSEVIFPEDKAPKIDFHISMMSLPGVFQTLPQTIPNDIPYVSVKKNDQKKWQQIAGDWPKGLRIGIAWRGSANHPRDELRSPGLGSFLSLGARKDVVLVSLQKEGGADELAAHSGPIRVINPTDMLEDFSDTAALIDALDVVVSCDSAPLHLAGALGAKTIAVLPHVAEWRWGQSGTKTPWYPTMTLVRQPSFGDWDGAFAEVIKALGDPE